MLTTLGLNVELVDVKLLMNAFNVKIQMARHRAYFYFPRWGTRIDRHGQYFHQSKGRVMLATFPSVFKMQGERVEVLYKASVVLETKEFSGFSTSNRNVHYRSFVSMRDHSIVGDSTKKISIYRSVSPCRY